MKNVDKTIKQRIKTMVKGSQCYSFKILFKKIKIQSSMLKVMPRMDKIKTMFNKETKQQLKIVL